MFDLIVIGGGPGGYLAAERAGHAGLSVLLFEKNALGGVCLNEGCIPSKTLLYAAKTYDNALHGEKYGVSVKGASLNQAAVIERKNKVVAQLVNGVKGALRASKVTVEYGEAKILGKTAEGFSVSVNSKEFSAKNLIVATGSSPFLPPIKGIDGKNVLTNKGILDLKEIPKNLVVVGGGVIGLEMASYYNSAGSKVTVLEMLPYIAGNTDREISNLLKAEYEAKGVTFLLGCKVTELSDAAVTYEKDGKAESVKADKILVSIGRRPVINGFGLENTGVLTERGAIVADDRLKTNVPGLYAVGDVNGKIMLAHAAYRQAEVAVDAIWGGKDSFRTDAVPSVIYTNPEVGCVGETDESAAAKGIAVKRAVLPLSYSGRYLAENEGGKGIIKLLVNAATDRIIGCHIIGGYAGEVIIAAAILIENEIPLSRAKKIVFPHPTVCEIIREAIFAVK
jgi:dihydrolipoamide dehydrogenase